MNKLITSVCALFALNFLAAAQAEDNKTHAEDKNLIKAGVVALFPNDDSTELAGPMTPPGVLVDVQDSSGIAGSFTRFFSDRFGAEVLVGLPIELEVEGSGSLAGIGEVSSAEILAPTLLLNYYFSSPQQAFRPYVALAVNYTEFNDAKSTATLNGLLSGETQVSLDSSTGLGAFAGFNYNIRKNFYISGLLGYVDVDSTATLRTDTVVLVSGSPVSLGVVERTIDIELDPTVTMLTAGFSF